jgi:hypothetical protein
VLRQLLTRISLVCTRLTGRVCSFIFISKGLFFRCLQQNFANIAIDILPHAAGWLHLILTLKLMSENTPHEENKGSEQKSDVKGILSQLEAILDEYMVNKAPFTLPTEVKEFIVKVSPYLVIIFAVMALPIIFAALGLTAFLSPFAMMGGYRYGFGWGFFATVGLVFSVITFIIEIIAVPGLFKRTKSAWTLLFYASIVSLIGTLLSFNGLVGGIIGAIIGWYILFQVKELYKN